MKTNPHLETNRRVMETLVAELHMKLERVRQGGGVERIERHRKSGRMFVRERIEHLFDPGTEFLELGALAADGMYDGSAPSAGIVTGIGQIHGREVVVAANDATVKGGTYFPMTVKKHLRAQEVAFENHLPCVYLVDSGGAFLPLQAEVFPDRDHFGAIFYNQAHMSAAGIYQVAAVLGSCTAGGAYVPAMSDEAVIVKNQGTIFLGGPPLVKAATGRDVTAEELGGADVHCRISGVADHYAKDDADALRIVRDIFQSLPRPEKHGLRAVDPEAPREDPSELYEIIPTDTRRSFGVREVILRIVDRSEFQEFKALYGRTLVCGFARIEGYPVGILANNGVLFSESAFKGTHFVSLCCQRGVPIVFLQNVPGFMVGKQFEHRGITKDGAKMVNAVANAAVPKFTVIIGGSYGAGNYAMCGRAYRPRQLWMWPNAKISVMGGDQAAQVLLRVKMDRMRSEGRDMTDEEQKDFIRPTIERYKQEGNVYYSTARLWDDGVIDPLDTRRVLAVGISAAMSREPEETRFGVFRM